MKSRLQKFLDTIQGRFRFKLTRQFWVYMLCLIVSFAFWALTTLSKDYTTTLYFPINYTNLPKDKIVAINLPENLAVEVNSFGFSLLWYKIKGKLQPISFKAGEDDLKSYGKGGKYYIACKSKIPDISNQLGNDLAIQSVRPDTIFFKFSTRAFKKVPVKIVNDVTFDRQHQLSGDMMSQPAEVTISGPKSVIDTIKAVFTDKVSLQNLSKSVEKNVKLKVPKIPNVELSSGSVDVIIPVEKFTEGRIELELTASNLPAGYKMKLFPEKVEVVFLVPLSRFDEAKSSPMKAYIDFNETKGNTQKLKVSIKQVPDFIRSVKITPETVEYIIQK